LIVLLFTIQDVSYNFIDLFENRLKTILLFTHIKRSYLLGIADDCNFDQDLCYWSKGGGTSKWTWTRHSGKTSSYGTGPTGDHTTGLGNYLQMYITLNLECGIGVCNAASNIQIARNNLEIIIVE
jgi:hypothetical protein